MHTMLTCSYNTTQCYKLVIHCTLVPVLSEHVTKSCCWAGPSLACRMTFLIYSIKVVFMPYSSDFHSFKICFMHVSFNCPISKITIFSFYTKSLQRTRTPHILIYLLNMYSNKPVSLFSMGLHMYFQFLNLFSVLLNLCFYTEYFEHNNQQLKNVQFKFWILFYLNNSA